MKRSRNFSLKLIYFVGSLLLAQFVQLFFAANLFAQMVVSPTATTNQSQTSVAATVVVSPAVPKTAVPNQTQMLPPIDLSTSILSMVKGLAICISLLLVVVWVLKKIKSPMITGQGRKLKIIERLPVSAKSSILLVEVNKKKMLIGVGSDPVSLISDFVDSDVLDVSMDEVKSGDKNE